MLGKKHPYGASITFENNIMVMENNLIGLKVGNLVYDNKSQSNITITESNIGDTQNFEPIPITSEWLEEIGFQKRLQNKTGYPTQRNNKVEFRLDSSDNYDWENSVNNLPKVKYIHQLQNIYFTLTERELL